MYPHERSLVKEMQGRPFVLLGVNNDKKLSTAKKAVKENKLNWRSFYDAKTRKITGQFKIKGYPTIMLIDHNGVIVDPKTRLRGEKLDDEIDRLVSAAEDDGMQGEKFQPEMRTFRDKTGKHRIKAIAEAMSGDKVRLQKEEGGTIVIKLKDLSRSDQNYLTSIDLPGLDEDSDSTADSTATVAKGQFRTFTDSTGDHTVEAKFVKIKDGKVILEKRNGSTVKLPLRRLSDEDQEYVKSKSE